MKSFKNKNRIKKSIVIAKFSIFLIIVIFVPIYILFFNKEIISNFKNYNDLVDYIRSFGIYGALVFLGIQILQIVISVIPGQIVQIAAGAIYGIIPGIILAVIGVILGEALTFMLGKHLGYQGLSMIIGESKMESLTKKLNTKRSYLITFFFFMLPGVPKDIMCYVAGISKIKLKTFLIISVLGRLPIMIISIIFGKMLIEKNYFAMIIIVAVICIISIICFIIRKKYSHIIDHIYEKLS